MQAAVGSTDVGTLVETLKNCDHRLERQRSEVVAAYAIARERVLALREEISTLKSRLASHEEVQRAEEDLRDLLGVGAGTTTELIASARERQVLLRQREEMLTTVARLAEHRTKQLQQLGNDFPGRIETLRGLAGDTALRLVGAEKELSDAEALRSDSVQGLPLVAAMEALTRDAKAVGLREGRCPVCRSKISADQLEEGLADLRVTVDRHSSALSKTGEAIERARELVKKLRGELAPQLHELSRIAADAEIFDSDTRHLIAAASDAGLESVSEPPTRDVIDREVASTRHSLLSIQRALAALEVQAETARISDLERTIEGVQIECDDFFARQNKIDTARERGEVMRRTVLHVAGEVLEEKLASLAPLLSDLYLRIRPHSNWREVQYRLRGDVRRFLSLRVGADLNPRFILSSGQRRATGLAFLLSVHLSRTWCRLDTLVLEDPVQHIDDFRALHLVEVLSAIRQTGEQVICSVEDEDLAALLARRLRPGFEADGAVLVLGRGPDGNVTATEQAVRPMNYVLPFTARSRRVG